MKVEVEKFWDDTLKVKVRFEQASNFWVEDSTWVPKLYEIKHIQEVLMAVDEYNKIKRSIGKKLMGDHV